MAEFLAGRTGAAEKYLYALRPLLCFRYVEQYGKVAPVPFDELCAAVLPDSMRGVVDDLLAQKKQAREKETAPRIPELDAYLLAEFAHAEQVLEALPNPAAPDVARLNAVSGRCWRKLRATSKTFPIPTNKYFPDG